MPDSSPVPWSIFTETLSTAFSLFGLDPSRCKCHIYRIGAATHAADKGMSDAPIRAMGRCKSNAFLKYIRINSVLN